MINPYLIQILIDRVIRNGETNILSTILTGIAAITLLRAVLGYIKEYGFDYLGTRTNIDMSKDLFDHIQSLSFTFFLKDIKFISDIRRMNPFGRG
jgi:ATP-binding cassette subfamily B protein